MITSHCTHSLSRVQMIKKQLFFKYILTDYILHIRQYFNYVACAIHYIYLNSFDNKSISLNQWLPDWDNHSSSIEYPRTKACLTKSPNSQ